VAGLADRHGEVAVAGRVVVVTFRRAAEDGAQREEGQRGRRQRQQREGVGGEASGPGEDRRVLGRDGRSQRSDGPA